MQRVSASYASRPFTWGSTDCAHFAADCVEAITGRDLLGTLRGAYAGRLGAMARIRARGYRDIPGAVAGFLEAAGAARIDPRAAGPGDIGITAEGIVCVRFPAGFLARTERGLYGRVVPVTAWAI